MALFTVVVCCFFFSRHFDNNNNFFFSCDCRDSQSPESDQSYRRVTREFKRKKITTADDRSHSVFLTDATVPPQSLSTGIDENWWKDYFERKLEMEREKMAKEDERHKDRMNFQKMAIMLQERMEKVKVEAINNLTNALLRVQEHP